jgi:hypothetical protein
MNNNIDLWLNPLSAIEDSTKKKYMRLASLVTLFTLFVVPSIAFSGDSESSCYKAELLYDEVPYGIVKLVVSGGENILVVKIVGFTHPGEYSVKFFKDYYSNFVAGSVEIDDEGYGEAVFEVPFRSPDFSINISSDDIVLTSGEWVECEKPDKPLKVKVSPSSLNLNSNGKWVTVKITTSLRNLELSDFKMIVNDKTIDAYSVKVSRNHVILKFSREQLQEACDGVQEKVIISFKIGDQRIKLSDTIKIINKEKNVRASSAHGNKDKQKTNNGKGKNKKK